MEPDNPDDLDINLAELRTALDQVRAPKRIGELVKKRCNELSAENEQERQGLSKRWIPAALAASISAVAIGFVALRPAVEPEVIDLSSEPAREILIAQEQIPVRIHSLSRGAEFRYMDSRLYRDERGFTRIVYIQLPNED